MPSMLNDKKEKETAGPVAAPEWPGGPCCQEVPLAHLQDLGSWTSPVLWSHEFFPHSNKVPFTLFFQIM